MAADTGANSRHMAPPRRRAEQPLSDAGRPSDHGGGGPVIRYKRSPTPAGRTGGDGGHESAQGALGTGMMTIRKTGGIEAAGNGTNTRWLRRSAPIASRRRRRCGSRGSGSTSDRSRSRNWRLPDCSPGTRTDRRSRRARGSRRSGADDPSDRVHRIRIRVVVGSGTEATAAEQTIRSVGKAKDIDDRPQCRGRNPGRHRRAAAPGRRTRRAVRLLWVADRGYPPRPAYVIDCAKMSESNALS